MAGVSAQFSVTVRVELDSRNEPLGKITGAIAESEGALQSVDLVPGAGAEGKRVREFTIDARSPEHWEQILRAIGGTRGARVLDYRDRPDLAQAAGVAEQRTPMAMGELRQMQLCAGSARFDPNVDDHHHLLCDRVDHLDPLVRGGGLPGTADEMGCELLGGCGL